MFIFTGKVMRWAPVSQIVKDYPWREDVTRCSKTAKRLPRERRFSQNNELNLETEDLSQCSYLDKLDFEKKAIHLICPGVFS